MGNLALPCGSLTPLMPTDNISIRLAFLYCELCHSLTPSNMSKNCLSL